MKILLLMRHAQATQDSASQLDFDRPLTERGLNAAEFMGELMHRQNIEPELVLSSPAERAKQTAAHVLQSAALATELRYDERIYEASAARLLKVISEIEESARVVMLVGHNPGMEELLERLTTQGQHLPTAALAKIALDIPRWSKASEQKGRLEWLAKPQEHMEK